MLDVHLYKIIIVKFYIRSNVYNFLQYQYVANQYLIYHYR